MKAVNVHPNSLEAYDSVALASNQAKVLGAIRARWEKHGRDSADTDIAADLGWTINRVTGRRGELHTMGLIIPTRRVRNAHGRKVQLWRPAPQQLSLWDGVKRPVRRSPEGEGG